MRLAFTPLSTRPSRDRERTSTSAPPSVALTLTITSSVKPYSRLLLVASMRPSAGRQLLQGYVAGLSDVSQVAHELGCRAHVQQQHILTRIELTLQVEHLQHRFCPKLAHQARQQGHSSQQ